MKRLDAFGWASAIAVLSIGCGARVESEPETLPGSTPAYAPERPQFDPAGCVRDGAAWQYVTLDENPVQPDQAFGRFRLWGSDARNVYRTSTREIELHHFDGKAWSPLNAVSTEGWYSWDVSGTGDRDVVIAARTDSLRRFDGSTWIKLGHPPDGLVEPALYAYAPQKLLAVGQYGVISWLNGITWASNGSPTTNHLRAVDGSSEADIFAVGDGVALHFDGKTWSSIAGVTQSLVAVRAIAPGRAIALAEGVTLELGPDSVKVLPESPCFTQTDVWASGPNDILVVGDMCLSRFDGVSWTHAHPAGFESLYAIWGSAEGDLFVSTARGVLYCKR